MEKLPHVIQPETYEMKEDIHLKGKWIGGFFKNIPTLFEDIAAEFIKIGDKVKEIFQKR